MRDEEEGRLGYGRQMQGNGGYDDGGGERREGLGVGWWREEGHTFRSSKVDNVSVFFEHVHLLNGLDGLHIQLLEGGLELLVVGAGCLVDFLHFSSGGAFSSVRKGNGG